MWEAPSPEDLQAMLPQYEISAILGRGGMGAVYRGRQVKLNRDVAIKLLPETLAAGDDELNFAARFEQEAQAMANLDHPGIVSVYDFGETAAGQCYFVMEFIDGMDIHQYLRANGGRLSQEHALAIASHVLDALEYAHGRGIIHRDIKPANVLLNQDGRVKIADFGLAKKISADGDDAPALTMSNVALGTPDFVAPESLEGGRVPDHRADLYAVGVMLYQMLTGALPRGQFKTPCEHRPELDFRLDEIVSRAMQTDPDDRYGSATEIRSDLDRVAYDPVTKVEVVEEGADVPAAVPRSTVTPSKRSKAVLWTAVAAGSVAAIVVALVLRPAQVETAGQAVSAPSEAPPEVSLPSPAVAEAAAAAVSEEPPPSAETAEPAAESAAETPHPPAPPIGATHASASAPVVVAEAPQPEPSQEVAENEDPSPNPAAEKEPTVAAASEEPVETAPEEELIPELEIRLNGYLGARRDSVLELASRYEAALSARTDAAADGGDLPLVKAYRDEANAVAKLKEDLAEPGGDLAKQVKRVATLPALAADAPPELSQLRVTWANEYARTTAALDAQLQQSLLAAERQLTVAREFEKAEIVLTFRESLGTPPVPQPAAEPASAPVEAAAEAAAEVAIASENPFGWKPIPDDPFPLARPQRQTTPCRVVAFRMDGEPVDEAVFREAFGGVPADFGEVVDLTAFTSIFLASEGNYFISNSIALRADGTCSAMRWHPSVGGIRDQLTDVVAIDIGRFSFIALRGDGTAVAAGMQTTMMREENIDFDEVADWKDIVRISAGDFTVGGVTASGEAKLAGDNRFGQREIPEDLQSDILDVDVKNLSSVSALLQKTRNGFRFVKFGKSSNILELDKNERCLVHFNAMVADNRGRPTRESIRPNAVNTLEKLGRTNLRDVIRMVRAEEGISRSTMGITAVCEENDRWTFWGNTDEVGGFDPAYCSERAAGAWKLFPMYPYVLALKPVSKLTPDDWTGTGAEASEP